MQIKNVTAEYELKHLLYQTISNVILRPGRGWGTQAGGAPVASLFRTLYEPQDGVWYTHMLQYSEWVNNECVVHRQR